MRRVMMILGGVVIALTLLIGAFVVAAWVPERTVEDLQSRWAPTPSVFVGVAGMKVHLRDEGPKGGQAPDRAAARHGIIPPRLGRLG